MILSNCSIFDDRIFELINKELIILNCSLDAGTRETFKRIKGVDSYERVKSNLRKYSSGGKGKNIELKYILLDKENCNSDDANGFLDFANEIGARITISLDYRSSERILNEREKETLLLMSKRIKKEQINCGVQYNLFNKKDIGNIERMFR